jgi:hypothetical protein
VYWLWLECVYQSSRVINVTFKLHAWYWRWDLWEVTGIRWGHHDNINRFDMERKRIPSLHACCISSWDGLCHVKQVLLLGLPAFRILSLKKTSILELKV